MNDYNFGNFVCMLREKNGLTQAEIAERLGVTAAAVSKWENGSSKPRVEVLFKLAEILGVRPEELMAGHYIEGSELDPEAVRNINERYEYLRRIDSHNTMGVKFRRLAAFGIDWNIIGIFVLLLVSIVTYFIRDKLSNLDLLTALGIMLLILMYPVLVILRDVIFGKRSIGKRILGLIVIDRQTGEVAKPSKRILRNLFLPLAQIDGFVMLFSGSSVGDRVVNAAVIPIKSLYYDDDDGESNSAEKINSYKTPKPMTRRTVIALIATILGIIVLFVFFILGVTDTALDAEKDTERYKLAYSYLVDSEKFKQLGIEESDLKFNSVSTTSSTNIDGEKVRTAEFGWRIDFTRSIYVICHDDGEGWYVCEECTKFD